MYVERIHQFQISVGVIGFPRRVRLPVVHAMRRAVYVVVLARASAPANTARAHCSHSVRRQLAPPRVARLCAAPVAVALVTTLSTAVRSRSCRPRADTLELKE